MRGFEAEIGARGAVHTAPLFLSAHGATGGVGGLAIRRGSKLLHRVSRAQFGAGHVGLSQLSAIRGVALTRTGERLKGVAGGIAVGGFALDVHQGDMLGMFAGGFDFAMGVLIDATPGAGTIFALVQLGSCKLR